jgi:putative transposase
VAKKSSRLSRSEKSKAIDPDNKIAIYRQCDLLNLPRSAYYYRPKGESKYNIMLMNMIDKIYTECTFYGYLRITHKLRREGLYVNHKRITGSWL